MESVTEKKYETNFFGEFTVSNDIEIRLNGEIVINGITHYPEIRFVDCYQYYNKMKKCVKIIDDYHKINNIGKRGIVKNYLGNGIVKGYIEEKYTVFDGYIFIKEYDKENYNKIGIHEFIEKTCPAPAVDLFFERGDIVIVAIYTVGDDDELDCIMVEMNNRYNVKNIKIV